MLFVRPDPAWRKPVRIAWITACGAVFAIVAATIVAASPVTSALTSVDGNLAFGFARVDPLVMYQEIRGRYSFCGYDWDMRCQLRDAAQTEEPPVDRWLEAHPPGISAAQPPTQGDVAFVETEGAQSLIVDDVRIADIEYFLGVPDVASHLWRQVASGGFASLAAVSISLALGFAAFGGPRMRAINPLWVFFSLSAAAFFAWAGVHAFSLSPAFGLLVFVEIVALCVLPMYGLTRLRSLVARRETAYAFFAAAAARAGSFRATTR